MSLDPPEKQATFAQAQEGAFPLIGDPNKEIGRAYDVLRLGGWLLAKRVIFVIDRQGIIRRVIQSEFNIDSHSSEAAAALRALGA